MGVGVGVRVNMNDFFCENAKENWGGGVWVGEGQMDN